MRQRPVACRAGLAAVRLDLGSWSTIIEIEGTDYCTSDSEIFSSLSLTPSDSGLDNDTTKFADRCER